LHGSPPWEQIPPQDAESDYYKTEQNNEAVPSDGNSDSGEETELSQNMAEIDDILSDLFKLSFKIRSAATRQSHAPSAARALQHKEMIQVDGVHEDLFDIYHRFDRLHVEEAFRHFRRIEPNSTGGNEPLSETAASVDSDTGLFLRA